MINPSFREVSLPWFLCRGDVKHVSAFEGLRLAGPRDRGECPEKPNVLFVFPDELKDRANTLFKALRDGIGPFSGAQKLLGFQLEKERMARVESFKAPNIYASSNVKNYEIAIGNFLKALKVGAKPDLAIIIHPKTDRTQEHNPYLATKFPLLAANIPTQVVTCELIDSENNFKWSVGNIALQMFAKMGGIPWIIQTDLSEDSIIVGINRASVITRGKREVKRHYGFASVFSSQGVYRETRLFPPAEDWRSYLVGFKNSIQTAIADWATHGKSKVNLILNVTKEIGRDETKILEESLEAGKSKGVRDYAVLKLTNSENFLIFDTQREDSFAPPKGTMVQLGDKRAILQVNGVTREGRSVGRAGAGEPWQIKLLVKSDGAPSFANLCTHTLALSGMNWRGLNAQETPVSIAYPERAAELLARFAEAGFDVSSLKDAKVMKRVWFL